MGLSQEAIPTDEGTVFNASVNIRAIRGQYPSPGSLIVIFYLKRYDGSMKSEEPGCGAPAKSKLFDKIKRKGLFWSYGPTIRYTPDLDSLLIETVLKYGDYENIRDVFHLYDRVLIQTVWRERVMFDSRFLKTNYFLARMFFGMKVEADYFSGGMNEREKKLRLLAT